MRKEEMVKDKFVLNSVYHVTLKLLVDGLKQKKVVPITLEFRLSDRCFENIAGGVKRRKGDLQNYLRKVAFTN